MLSIKRLMRIVAILIMISIAFLMLSVSNTLEKTQNKNNYADADVTLQTHKISDNATEKYLVVGSAKDDTERQIQENVIYALTNMKLFYQIKNKIDEKDLTGKPIIIFTCTRISDCASLPWVGDYISGGGKVMFAAGLPENNQDSYLNPVWGIVEKGSRTVTKGFHFLSDFLPYHEVTTDYNGYNVSTSVHLMSTVHVFMESKEKIPVVYSNSFNTGKAVVINGTLLDNRNSGGIFSAALGELQDELIYPILGTKSVYLDAFPTLSNANDQISFQLYGRSVEAFTRDILWPELLRNASKYNLKYTANILGVDSEQYDLNLVNQRLLAYLVKQILQSSGEIGIAADYSADVDGAKEQVESLNRYLKSNFVNYNVSAYSILYGKIDMQSLHGFSDQLGDFKVVRGVYSGDANTQQIQKFGVEDGIVTYPTLTSGYVEGGGELFDFLSALCEHGAISHSFNIENLIFAQSKQTDWDALKDSYDQLNRDFFSDTSWLKAASLSEAAQNAKAYESLKITVQKTTGRIGVDCDQFMVNQSFFLRSSRAVKQVIGGEFVKINNAYYMITATEPEFTIELE